MRKALILLKAVKMSSSFLAPVIMILPEAKIRKVILGTFIL